MQGRLGNLYQMPEQMKHPIILPRDSRITELIILQHHQSTAHSGPELTLRNVRLQFWIVGGKRQRLSKDYGTVQVNYSYSV